jgi:hypothetical protein
MNRPITPRNTKPRIIPRNLRTPKTPIKMSIIRSSSVLDLLWGLFVVVSPSLFQSHRRVFSPYLFEEFSVQPNNSIEKDLPIYLIHLGDLGMPLWRLRGCPLEIELL